MKSKTYIKSLMIKAEMGLGISGVSKVTAVRGDREQLLMFALDADDIVRECAKIYLEKLLVDIEQKKNDSV